ncbi:Spo21p Ecym_2795 [Eremothecium cymbalariae DBVPG|uniref:Uncharacterized protein n=1 Tax=Eremothecium cymbalariae (strain CBS 270.75 / DBVPG 7215 / KCTC 17166 / NRRL Y-17582) TaxID=931890 RepID=G8JQ30_ERECY|nr:Hypothetical protein Ecym_2795 [Eremothecium cymbalariae DBVPG\
MSLLEQPRSLGTKLKDPTSHPFSISNYTVHDDSEITTSDDDGSSYSSSSDRLDELEQAPVLTIPTPVSEKSAATWFAGRSKSSGVVDDIKSSDAHPVVLTSFRKSISSFFRRDSNVSANSDVDGDSESKSTKSIENMKKKHPPELKSWTKWRGKHFHRKDGIVTEPEPELERDREINEWEKETSLDTTDIGKIDVTGNDADTYMTDYELNVKKHEVNYAKLTRIDIKDLYPDVISLGQDADEEDAYQDDDDDSDVSSIEAQSKKLKVKFVEKLIIPDKNRNTNSKKLFPDMTYQPMLTEQITMQPSDEVRDIEAPPDIIQRVDNSYVPTACLEAANKGDSSTLSNDEPYDSMIYNFIYESPNAKNKSIDLWQVDHHSVTFGKFSEIIQILNGDTSRIRFRDSLVEILDYTLSLTAQKAELLKKLETTINCLEDKNAHDAISKNALEREVAQLHENINEVHHELESKKEELLKLSEQFSNEKLKADLYKRELGEVTNKLHEKEQELSLLQDEWSVERQQLVKDQIQANQSFNAWQQKCEEVKKEFNMLNVKWKNIQFDYSRIEAEKKALDEKFHSTVASLTEKESSERQLVDENHRLEAAVKTKVEQLERTVSGNKQLQADCRRERNKLNDLKTDYASLKEYVNLIECFKNQSLHFVLQFIVNFRQVIDNKDFADVQHLVDRFSKTKMWTPKFSKSNNENSAEEELLKNIENQQLIANMYQETLKGILYMVTNKFIEGQRANKFLTQQLIILRKELSEKDDFIKRILADTNELTSKLDQKREQVLLLEETQKQIQTKIHRLERKLGKNSK